MKDVTRKHPVRGRWLVGLIGLSLASLGWADSGTWTTHGPVGGDVRTIAIDPAHPSTVYAGTIGGGVYKSTDGGGSWTAINAGLTYRDVTSLVIDPAAPATIYAATGGGGLFRSLDGGQSWTPAGEGIVNPYVDSLAIGPSGLYAGTGDGGSGAGVYRSGDHGDSWTPINAGLEARAVAAVAIDPSAPSTLYAGTQTTLFKSTNEGQTWTHIATDMSALVFAALAIDRSKPSTVYAATYAYDYLPGGIFKSVDGGSHWQPARGPGFHNRDAYCLALNPSNPSVIYAGTQQGIAVSTNGGVTWADRGGALPVLALAIDPSSPSTVYAGTSGGGIFKSIDSGLNWTAGNAGLFASRVRALALDPSGQTTIYAAHGAGISKSEDGGASWVATGGSPPTFFVNGLAMDPSAATTLYAATDAGVFKSLDAGDRWTAANSGLTEPGGVVQSVTSLAIHPSAPATLYAGTYSGVVKSLDGGASWAVGGALPADWMSVYGLVIDPSSPATLYALTNGGVFKSVDGAANWTESLTHRFVSALTIDRSAPSTLYAASDGIWKSTDGGMSWNSMPASPANTTVTALVLDPRSSAVLYAAGGVADRSAGAGGGVFRSTDGGETWVAINEGMTAEEVGALVQDPATGTRLYAGTIGGGVFERDVTVPTPCHATTTRLCLAGNRYAVELSARRDESASAPGIARSLGDRAGYFSFPFATGNPELPEVIVKMLEDRAFGTPGAPVFYASLTTLPYVLTVTDGVTGQVASYASDPAAPLCGGTALAFPGAAATSPLRAASASAPGKELSLLSGRFSVALEARFPDTGRIVRGTVLASGDGYGLFSLPEVSGDPQFPEVAVKMLDGRSLTGGFWFFHSGLTSLDYVLTVVDSATGAVRTYDSPSAFCGAADLHAFAGAPAGGPLALNGGWIGTLTFPSDCYTGCQPSDSIVATLTQDGNTVTGLLWTQCIGRVALQGTASEGQLVVDFAPPSGNPFRGPVTSTHVHVDRNCDPWGYGSDFAMVLDLSRGPS